MISVIVPLYNEKDSISQLYAELVKELELSETEFELLFVDDGSTDGSVEVLKSLQRGDQRVRVVRFRRNFGKSAALQVGFKQSRGEIVLTLDADLQDRPHEIRKLLGRLEQGFDLVSGWRYRRRDPWSKRMASRIFNSVTARMTGINIHDINCGLKAYRRKVIEEIRVYGEMHRYIPVLASYRGFRVGEVEVEHSPRRHGQSKYGVSRMIGGVFDLITVVALARYSSKPLHIFGIMGSLLGVAGFGILAYLSVLWWTGTYIEGRPLFLLGILLTIVGAQSIFFGLLAEMIAYSSRREDDYSIRELLEPGESLGRQASGDSPRSGIRKSDLSLTPDA